MTTTLDLLWRSVWADNPLLGKLVILVILGLFLRVLWVGSRMLRHYEREDRDLRRVAGVLEDWRRGLVAERSEGDEEGGEGGGQGEVDSSGEEAPEESPFQALEEIAERPAEESENARYSRKQSPGMELGFQHPSLIDIDHLMEPIRSSSLIGERIAVIRHMRSYRVKVDLEMLQQLSARRDAAMPGSGFPAFAAGLAMMLGILGTFAGLAAMVQEIHLGIPHSVDSVDLSTWGDSLESLSSVLGGMKTAFSTSLAGMTTAIVGLYFSYSVQRAREETFEKLERLTSKSLLPATVPAVEDELLLERVSLQLEESFHRLDEISRQNRETLRDLSAAQEVYLEILEDLRDITRGQAARNLDALIEKVGGANDAVLQVVDHLPRLAESMASTGRRIEWMVGEFHVGNSQDPTGDGSRIFGLTPVAWVWLLVALVVGLGLLQLAGG